MTVIRFRDGSLVVPARFTTSDGSAEDGVKRIDRRHPLYDAWRAYCERNPDEVVERRRRLGDAGEDLAEGLAAACCGLVVFSILAASDGLKGAFDGVAVGAVVALGSVVCFCFFIWGLVDSQRWRNPSEQSSRANVEVEPPPGR
jgi:hypothetical protein